MNKSDEIKFYQHRVASILLNKSWKKYKLQKKNKNCLSPLRYEISFEDDVYYMDIDEKEIQYMDIY